MTLPMRLYMTQSQNRDLSIEVSDFDGLGVLVTIDLASVNAGVSMEQSFLLNPDQARALRDYLESWCAV